MIIVHKTWVEYLSLNPYKYHLFYHYSPWYSARQLYGWTVIHHADNIFLKFYSKHYKIFSIVDMDTVRRSMLLIFIFGLCVNYIESRSTDVVQTTKGPVQGEILTTVTSKKEYSSFKGIPYGEPPLGKLRFKVIRFLSVLISLALIT